jgi:hypothetical protein
MFSTPRFSSVRIHRLLLVAGAGVMLGAPLPVLAQDAENAEAARPDYSVRDIPADRRTVATHGTEVVEGIDPEGIPHYRVNPFWPQPLPNNWLIGQVAGVWVSEDDHVWAFHRPMSLSDRELGAIQDPPINKCCYPMPPVVEFDPDGNVVNAWGGPDEGYDWFENEHGVHVDGEDFVWLGGNGENDHHILKFTREGEFVMQIGTPGASQGSNDTENLNRPADVSVDLEAQEVYVADGYGNRRVIVFDSETGEYKRHWGAYGNEPHDDEMPGYDPEAEPADQFGSPVHCVYLSRDDLVYVCDRVNNRYQVFEKDGTFVSEAFFEPYTLLNGSVSDLTMSMAEDFIFMVDGVNNEMRIVDRERDETVARVGRPGRMAGQFHVVHDIAIDSAGNLYTTEVNTGQRIQRFEPVDPSE